MANQDVYRPKIGGEPFSTQLVVDRASLGWQQNMEVRYYVLPIHTSKTFLSPPTLSASLYLILLKLLHRDYAAAFRQIEACSVDTPFTSEEGWVWVQLERTLTDSHPDAHACRLKLTLAVQYSQGHSTNKPKWQNHTEMTGYLSKLSHVSAACRLSLEEELEALYLSKTGTPLIKSRLAYLKAAKAESPDVTLVTDPPRWGGQPWLKLNLQSLDYITQNGSKLARVHYRRPNGPVADGQCLDLVWSDLMLMDEESGANRQLGFAFLYELARGTVTATVAGIDVTEDMAGILGRYFHLKMSRWGKEQVRAYPHPVHYLSST